MADNSIQKWAQKRLRQYMQDEGIDVVLLSSPVNVAYLSGYQTGNYLALIQPLAFCLVTLESAALVVPSSVSNIDPEIITIFPYENYSIHYEVDTVSAMLKALGQAMIIAKGCRHPAVELGNAPASAYEVLREQCGSEVKDITKELRELRAVKCQAEVEAIRTAVHACDCMFEAVENEVREGHTELDVYNACIAATTKFVSGPAVLDGDFVSGERTAEVGGPATARQLQKGDLLIMDIYPRVGLYWADVTRTYVVGPASQELIDRHAVLEEALKAGEKAAAPGLPTKEFYYIVKSVLDKAGYGQYSPHHMGHCIGLTPSENPRIIPGSEGVLQTGMVFTLEPGMYPPGKQGMRLEDNYVVTESGCASLSQYRRKLISLGG